MKIGRERIYNKNFKDKQDVILWEVIDINEEQNIKVNFINNNTQYRQGVRLGIDTGDGYIRVNGICSKSIELWEDTAPDEVYCKCKSTLGKLSVYNIWDKGNGKKSQLYTSGMILVKEKNKYTYYCNDVGFNNKFKKLIFSIKLI